jgi:hypothetical protein
MMKILNSYPKGQHPSLVYKLRARSKVKMMQNK